MKGDQSIYAVAKNSITYRFRHLTASLGKDVKRLGYEDESQEYLFSSSEKLRRRIAVYKEHLLDYKWRSFYSHQMHRFV